MQHARGVEVALVLGQARHRMQLLQCNDTMNSPPGFSRVLIALDTCLVD